jgi:hypothetical protein
VKKQADGSSGKIPADRRVAFPSVSRMRKTGVIAIVTVIASGVACWMIKPGPAEPSVTSDTSSGASPAKSSHKRPSVPDDRERKDALISEVAGQATRAPYAREPGPAIDGADYPKLLEAILRHGGADGRSGLAFSDKAAFDKLVGDWYAADPERATRWVRSIKNPEDLRELGDVLIATAVGKDYDAAICLMQEFSLNKDGQVVIPETVMKAAALHGAAELLELSSLSPLSVEKDPVAPLLLSYPQDFNFQAALEGFAELHAKGVKPATYPANLLDEWAKRDPEAAFGWFVNSDPGTHTGTFSTYFYDLARSASADELASSVSLALSVGGNSERMLETIARNLCEHDADSDSLARISEMLGKLPEAVDQTGLRVALMQRTAWSGEDGAHRRESFLHELGPEERVSLMKHVFSDKGSPWSSDSLDSLKQTLIALGHPAEQVSQLVPEAAKDE